jgi:hypothetical protein
MFRATNCSTEFTFAADCPDDVKSNILQRCLSASERGKVATVPPLYRQWVTITEERVSGLWLPLIGFVSDERIAQIRARLRRVFKS